MREIEFRGILLEDVLYCNPRKTKIPPSFDDILKYGRPGGLKIVRYRKGEWVYGSLVTDGSKCWIVGKVTDASDECISFESWFPVDPATVGQYTCLKDKHGAKIYKDDIVVQDCYLWFDDGEPNYRGVVEWIYSQWQVVAHCVNPNKKGISDGVNEGLNDEGFGDGDRSRWEVIGNIYDNPELLKGDSHA